MTVLISDNGEFSKGLKFEARASGHRLSHGPVYGPAGYLALRLDSNNRDTAVRVLMSTDGTSWAEVSDNIDATSSQILGLDYINNNYVIWGYIDSGTSSSSILVYTSTDGLTWTKNTGNALQYSLQINSIVYSNSLYQASGRTTASSGEGTGIQKIYTSSDLVTWTQRLSNNIAPGTRYYLSETLVASAATSNKTVGIGTAQTYVTATGAYLGTEILYFYTNNGTSYYLNALDNSLSNTVYNWAPTSIATNGSRWVIVGTGGNIYTSDTVPTSGGMTWTARTSGTTGDLYSVNYANGKWVVQGTDQILTSLDGTTWSIVSVPVIQFDDILYYSNGVVRSNTSKAIYANSKWIVSDYQSTDDGATWSVLDYQIPNKQPFIKYPFESSWNTWKTLDFWVYIPSHPEMFTQFAIASERGSWTVYLETQQSGSLTIKYLGPNFPSGASVNIASSFTFGQWNHMRLVVDDGGVASWYLNGSRKTTATLATRSIGNDTLNLGISSWVGENQYARPVDYFIDEFMLSNELLNSPSATTITVPTAPFVNNEYTAILLHFNTNFEDDPSTPIRNAQATVAATFTQVTDAAKTAITSAALTTTASLDVTATKAVNSTASLDVTATLTAINSRTKQFSADLVVAASKLTANARTRGFGAILSSTASVEASATKSFGPVESNLSATTDLTASLVRIKEFSASLETLGSTLIADTRTRGDSANLTVTTELTVSAVRTRAIGAGLTCDASVTASLSRIKQFSVSLVVDASKLTVDQKTARTGIVLSTSSSLSASATRTRNGSATISCQANIVASGSQSKIIRSDLLTTSSLFVSTGNVIRTSANLVVGAFEVSTGRVINLDYSDTWIIPAENRVWIISNDNRLWTISDEDRTYTIKG